MNDFNPVYRQGKSGQTILVLRGESDLDLPAMASELWPDANLLQVSFSENDDMKAAANALADCVAQASQTHDFDARNAWSLGYAGGANLAASLFFVRPQTLCGAILLRAQTPLQGDLPDLSGKQILLLAGAWDDSVPTEDVQNLEHHFKAAGADVTLNLADADHDLSDADGEAARNWLNSRSH